MNDTIEKFQIFTIRPHSSKNRTNFKKEFNKLVSLHIHAILLASLIKAFPVVADRVAASTRVLLE